MRLSRKTMAGSEVVLSLFLVGVLVFSSGCEPLRKKFTRKKKVDPTAVTELPVLEPIDYPKKEYDPRETYKLHYSLWQVWHRELVNGLNDQNMPERRKSYLLEKIMTHLNMLSSLAAESKRGEMKNILEELQRIQADVQAAVPRLSPSALRNQLMLLDRKVRRNFDPDVVLESQGN